MEVETLDECSDSEQQILLDAKQIKLINYICSNQEHRRPGMTIYFMLQFIHFSVNDFKLTFLYRSSGWSSCQEGEPQLCQCHSRQCYNSYISLLLRLQLFA